MVSHWRETIGKRPANTTCDTFRSIPTDENGAIAKVEQSTPNLTSCGRCTSGVTRSSRMRSRCDLSENRACLPPRANVTAWLTGSRRASRFSFLQQRTLRGHAGKSEKGQSRHFGYVPVNSGLHLPAQPVDATQALNLSAGVSNCK